MVRTSGTSTRNEQIRNRIKLTLSDTIAEEMLDANEELRPEEALIYNFQPVNQ